MSAVDKKRKAGSPAPKLKSKPVKAAVAPSANWIALQKKNIIPKPNPHTSSSASTTEHPRKKRKLAEHETHAKELDEKIGSAALMKPPPAYLLKPLTAAMQNIYAGECTAIQRLFRGEPPENRSADESNRFVAIDCEMVGVGPNGSESVLARVSIVNWHGEVLMDEFVRPKERVTDYRTKWSGVRETDLINAKTFEEVQKLAADLIKDKVVVGHAVSNDLKALLLTHPWPLIRDTQQLATKHKISKSKKPALRILVQDELGETIQEGEHSSVIDARATMAIYRLHRKTFDKDWRRFPSDTKKSQSKSSESKNSIVETVLTNLQTSLSNRKGVSSGLSTVVKRIGPMRGSGPSSSLGAKGGSEKKWWDELPAVDAMNSISKGSMRLKVAADSNS